MKKIIIVSGLTLIGVSGFCSKTSESAIPADITQEMIERNINWKDMAYVNLKYMQYKVNKIINSKNK